jgi:cytochrome c oxidase cbb3-type subunit 3
MKSMVIGGIILIVALMAGTYFVAGDSFQFGGDDNVNNLTMLGALAIITITVAVALKYVNQIKNDKAQGELVEESWDGIGEYKNPIPSGWGIIFLGSIIWMNWYFFVGYPTNQFSQVGQWNEETLAHQAKFEKQFKDIDQNGLRSMGESVYLVQCAPCHGVDAEGINGKAHNLTKRMSKEQVLDVINNGANNFKTDFPGGMPAGMAFGEGAEKVAEYVANGMKGEQPAEFGACAGCHGVDGKGMPYVAPSIADYSDDLIKTVLHDGKKGIIGVMPNFQGRLSETQVKAVAEYIRSIGGN